MLWQLARACYRRAKGVSSTTQRAELLNEALDYAERALELNDNNFAVHKWMAILVDEVVTLNGSKARIQKSFVMKRHMEVSGFVSKKLISFRCINTVILFK